MKKLVAILLAFTMLMLCACGDKKSDSSSKAKTPTKSDLKEANINAKLLYTTIHQELEDNIALTGNTKEAEAADNWCDVKDLKDSSNSFDIAVYEAFKDKGGYICYAYDWEFNDDYENEITSIDYAQWSDGNIVGQYPDPETDPEIEHSMGNKIQAGLHDTYFGDKKDELKQANSNAKLVYVTVNNQIADLEAEGNTADISTCCKNNTVEIESLKDSSNTIDQAIYNALKDEDDLGYIYFELSGDNNVTVAQWAESADSKIVGQYDYGELDSGEEHKIGMRFKASCPMPDPEGFRSKEENEAYYHRAYEIGYNRAVGI